MLAGDRVSIAAKTTSAPATVFDLGSGGAGRRPRHGEDDGRWNREEGDKGPYYGRQWSGTGLWSRKKAHHSCHALRAAWSGELNKR